MKCRCFFGGPSRTLGPTLLLAVVISANGGPDSTPPSVPASVSAAVTTCTRVDLSWSPSIDPSGAQSGLAGYRIYRNGSLIATNNGLSTLFTDTAVSAPSIYTYRVVAVDNSSNQSAQSAPSTASPCSDRTPPATPTYLSAAVIAPTQVNLNWPAASDSSGQIYENVAGVKSYELFRNGTAAINKITEVLHPLNTFSDATASPNSSYTYWVRTVDNNNNVSGFRTSVTVTTPFGAPDAPSGLGVAAQNCQQLHLIWNAPGVVGSGLAYYNIFRNGNLLFQSPTTSVTDNSVAAGMTYFYTVTAIDSGSRESAPSSSLTVITPACPAAPPSNLRIELDDHMAKLHWDGTGGALYQVQCSLGISGPWLPVDAPTMGFSVTNLAVQPSSIYRVALFTNTPAYLANFSVNIGDTTPPSVPTALLITILSETEAALSWDTVTDQGTTDIYGQTFTSGLDRYLVYRDGVFLKHAPASATASSDGTVLGDTQYTYSVAAIDKAGNRSSLISNSVLMRKPCNYSLSPNSAALNSSGGNGNLNMNTGGGCSWSSAPAVNWIHSSSSGTGNGVASFTVDANPGTAPRSGILYVGGKIFTINQAGVNCTYGLNPTGFSQPATAAAGDFDVAAPLGCAWTASTADAWVHTSSSGNGNGLIEYSLDANTTSAVRYGTINVAGQAFTISQAGTIPVLNLGEAVDNVSLTWTTGGDASWVGQTNVTFAAGDAAQSGPIGNGQSSWMETTVSGPATLAFYWKVSSEGGWDVLRFSIDGIEQTNISGEVGWEQKTFSIPAGSHALRWTFIKDPTCCASGADRGYLDQVQLTAGGCTYSLSSSVASLPSAGGPGSFNLIAGNTCTWTATTVQNWIHTSSSGLGNGGISFSVDLNSTTVPRSGTIVVGGQSFTINQAANQAPVANAGPDLSMSLGADTSFSAAGSFDPDGVISSYHWDFGDGWTGSGISVSHSYVSLGVYNVRLTITDNLGASSTDTMLATVITIPDVIPPTVNVGIPAGPNVSGVISVNASANDNIGVARVEFYRDATLFATATTPPFQANLDTRTVSNGSHSIMARAFDPANNSASSSGSVLVDNTAPVVSLTAPANGTIVSNSIILTASANDNSGGSLVSRVEFYLDGSLLGSVSAAPYNYSYDTRATFNGTHSLICKAFDGAGNSATSAAISLSVNNGGGPTTPGQILWVTTPATPVNDYARGVAADANGNVAVVGDLNGGLFVHKYSAAGTLIWSKQFGSSYGNAVAVDATGNIFATGYFMGGIDLGGGWLSGFGAYGATFVVKYAPDGTHLWSKAFASTSDGSGNSLAIDPAGNLFLTGQFGGTIDFGGTLLLSQSASSVFLAKLSGANGGHLMSKAFGDLGGGQDVGYGIAVDGSGNAIMTGTFLGSINFGGGALTSLGFDGFVAKFSSSGTHLWSKRFGGDSVDYGYSIAAAPNGEIVVGGSFRGTVDFGAGSMVNSGSYNDGFLAKFSSAGACVWSKQYAGSAGANDFCKSVAVDRNGNVFVTGLITGPFNFGAGSLAANYNDAFITKYDSAGGLSWAKILGDYSIDQGFAIATDAANNVFVAGTWYGTVDFGVARKTSIGGGDSFLIRLVP